MTRPIKLRVFITMFVLLASGSLYTQANAEILKRDRYDTYPVNVTKNGKIFVIESSGKKTQIDCDKNSREVNITKYDYTKEVYVGDYDYQVDLAKTLSEAHGYGVGFYYETGHPFARYHFYKYFRNSKKQISSRLSLELGAYLFQTDQCEAALLQMKRNWQVPYVMTVDNKTGEVIKLEKKPSTSATSAVETTQSGATQADAANPVVPAN